MGLGGERLEGGVGWKSWDWGGGRKEGRKEEGFWNEIY